ncbi:MAG TPA: hypothetical protein VHG08_22670 [Longimicrobium sp.]|nr:hypothetical protein [Longimicrobium sp.]
MPATLTVRDETSGGDVVGTRTLDFPAEQITVRELITRRVKEEAAEYDRARTRPFRGLVHPARGGPADQGGEVDWERQRDAALAAFAANGFFILVGDRQVESLDETIRLELDTEVSFVRLVPLVGG